MLSVQTTTVPGRSLLEGVTSDGGRGTWAPALSTNHFGRYAGSTSMEAMCGILGWTTNLDRERLAEGAYHEDSVSRMMSATRSGTSEGISG